MVPTPLGVVLACYDSSSPDQSVSSALLVAEPLPEVVVPDHSDLSSPSLLGGLLDRSEPWGCRYRCGAVELCSKV